MMFVCELLVTYLSSHESQSLMFIRAVFCLFLSIHQSYRYSIPALISDHPVFLILIIHVFFSGLLLLGLFAFSICVSSIVYTFIPAFLLLPIPFKFSSFIPM
jgi:hypothetical protein